MRKHFDKSCRGILTFPGRAEQRGRLCELLAPTYAAIRDGIGPAVLLATVGVLLTAGLTALFARWIGLSWTEAASVPLVFTVVHDMLMAQLEPHFGAVLIESIPDLGYKFLVAVCRYPKN